MVKTIKITERQLQIYDTNDCRLWWTPGASAPYWASQPNFMDDEGVAHPSTFLESAGYDCFGDEPLEDGDDGDIFELEVERPEA